MTKVNYINCTVTLVINFPCTVTLVTVNQGDWLSEFVTHTHIHTHTHTGEGAGEGGVAEDARGAGAGGGGGEEAQSGGGGAQTAGRAGNNNNNNDDTVRLFSRHLGLVLVSEIPRATKMVD